MASCSADDSYEDSVMTVDYVPIVGASESRNGESVCSSSNNVVSPEKASTSSPYESDDEVDYYAHERKRKKRRSSRERTFARHQSSASSEVDVAFLVVHFTPQHVMQDASTIHLVINESNECMGSVAVHRIQHKLHLLHPDIFPLLQDKGIPIEQLKKIVNEDTLQTKYERVESENVETKVESNNMDEEASNKENNRTTNDEVFSVIQARTFSTVHLRPQRRLCGNLNKVISFDNVSSSFASRIQVGTTVLYRFFTEVHDTEGMSESLASLQKDLLGTRIDKDRKYPEVLFLGTGSCIPNKTRNTSGILVHMSENDSFLLDCGEGTYGQLVRFFGPEKVDDIVRRIRAVFVSHLHADHHIGLVGLLKGRREALSGVQSPLYLIAPKQIMSWLKLYHRSFEPVLEEFVLVPNGNLVRKQYVHMTHIYKLNGVNLKHPVISDPVNIYQGVPQGSILGPILFILYVNGFDKLLQTSALCTMYADGLSIIVSNNDHNVLNNMCNSIMQEVLHLFNKKLLYLNSNKTTFMHFHTFQKKVDPIKINVNGSELIGSSNMKFLGLHLDENLNFHNHCNSIVSKLGSLAFIFRNLRSVLNLDQLITCYYAYVESKLKIWFMLLG
ncbi:hypothetical protein C0J52_22511 [Blattella germanica]|nr:hypothetical protein C0J52_22511 [Blattella germanica]